MSASRKLKTCQAKDCDKEFLQFNSIEKWCSFDCAMKIIEDKKRRKYAQETKRLKRENRAKDRSYQLRKAQEAFNGYIRARDKDKPCISCGAKPGTYRLTAGHYRTTGAHPELRFHPDNAFGQCWFNCNCNKSGNIIEMRKGMIERIGIERVEWIEGPHEIPNYSLDEIIEIKEYFKSEAKQYD